MTPEAASAAVAQVDKKAVMHEYILHHVMYHRPDPHAWNIPFFHAPFLDFFRYDQVILPFAALILISMFAFLYKRHQRVPHGWTNLLEVLVLFIRNHISIGFLGEKDGRRMAPLFCSFFFFILTLNLLSMVPIFSAATSNINVTGGLATITLFFMVFGAIYRNGPVGFIKAFMPSGVPWPILFILTPIEIIAMFGKVAALMIRLFANILAGHIITFALLGLVIIFGYYALPVVALVVCIYFFELFVAFFQTYIFTLLSAIFIGQIYHAEH